MKRWTQRRGRVTHVLVFIATALLSSGATAAFIQALAEKDERESHVAQNAQALAREKLARLDAEMLAAQEAIARWRASGAAVTSYQDLLQQAHDLKLTAQQAYANDAYDAVGPAVSAALEKLRGIPLPPARGAGDPDASSPLFPVASVLFSAILVCVSWFLGRSRRAGTHPGRPT